MTQQDPELYTRRLKTDVEEETFTLEGSSRYMSFDIFMRLNGHFEHYADHSHTYDASYFEDYAERLDCVLGSVKPRWRGHVIVFILYEFIRKAQTSETFDDRV
jgi:hypothetical protein